MANETARRLLARVKEHRKALGLTQEQFAERGGFDYKYYQHLEAGRKLNFTIPTLDKLAKACGVEVWELFHFDTEPMMLAEDPPAARPKPARRKSGR